MSKKIAKIIGISALFVCAFMLLFSQKTAVVSAESNCEECVAVIGMGEYCVAPDSAEICFTVSSSNSSVEKVLEEVNQKTQKIKTALNEIDASFENNIVKSFSTLHPVFMHGATLFEHRVNYKLTTSNLESVNQIIIAINNSDACCFADVCYTLSNTNQAYINALKDAKQNAIDKANALQDNLVLDKLIEQSVFCCSRSDNQNICIQASVKAIFKCCENEQEYVENEENKEVYEPEHYEEPEIYTEPEVFEPQEQASLYEENIE